MYMRPGNPHHDEWWDHYTRLMKSGWHPAEAAEYAEELVTDELHELEIKKAREEGNDRHEYILMTSGKYSW